jgi:hypothetical protein
MEANLGDWQRQAEYNQQTGMDAENPQNPEVFFTPTIDTFGHSMRQTLRGTGKNWGTGKPEAYSRALTNAGRDALSLNPHMPGNTRAEREAEWERVANLVFDAETPDAQEVAVRNTGKPMSTGGATVLRSLEGFLDPTALTGVPGAIKGAKTLVKGGKRAFNTGEMISEGIQEGVTAIPDHAISSRFPFNPKEDMGDHQRRLAAQEELMNSRYAESPVKQTKTNFQTGTQRFR